MVVLYIESTKKPTICISRFFLGFKVGEKLFFECETKAVASDSRKVNGTQCRQSRRRS